MCHVVGVAVYSHSIFVCSLTKGKRLVFKTRFKAPDPFMPGAVTVDISEFILSISSNFNIECIGVSFPGSVDKEGKLVKGYLGFPEWMEVPLGEWLEVRLKRNVLISNVNDCKHKATSIWNEKFNWDEAFQAACGAAGLAVDKFIDSKLHPSGSMNKI